MKNNTNLIHKRYLKNKFNKISIIFNLYNEKFHVITLLKMFLRRAIKVMKIIQRTQCSI